MPTVNNYKETVLTVTTTWVPAALAPFDAATYDKYISEETITEEATGESHTVPRPSGVVTSLFAGWPMPENGVWPHEVQ